MRLLSVIALKNTPAMLRLKQSRWRTIRLKVGGHWRTGILQDTSREDDLNVSQEERDGRKWGENSLYYLMHGIDGSWTKQAGYTTQSSYASL